MPFKRSRAAQSRARSGSDLLRLLQNHVGKDFDTNDFMIAGSARLFTEGISDHISDLDILARPGSRTWYRATDLAIEHSRRSKSRGLFKSEYTGDTIAQLYGGAIEVFDRWLLPEYDAKGLLDSAEKIGGLKYFSLEDILVYKRRLDRPKDQKDCANILAHLERREERTHSLPRTCDAVI